MSDVAIADEDEDADSKDRRECSVCHEVRICNKPATIKGYGPTCSDCWNDYQDELTYPEI